MYIANLVGGAAFAAIAVSLAQPWDVVDPTAFGDIARRMRIMPAADLLAEFSPVGSWGLLSWLVAAGRERSAKWWSFGL